MDAANNDGNTAAHLAFKFGHSELGECVATPALPLQACICLMISVTFRRYLLSKGASDSIENKDGLACRALARPQQLA